MKGIQTNVTGHNVKIGQNAAEYACIKCISMSVTMVYIMCNNEVKRCDKAAERCAIKVYVRV